MAKRGWAVTLALALLLASPTMVAPSILGQGARSVSPASSFSAQALGPDPGCPPSVGINGVSTSGLNVSVNGYANPCGSASIQYVAWNWGDGINNTTWAPYNLFPARHFYCASGSYVIKAEVVQSDGQTSETSVTVNLSGPDCSPAIELQNPAVYGLSVLVNGTASACGKGTSIASLDWSWGDGSAITSTGFPAQHTYQAAGSYLVSATVTQSDGRASSAAEWVTVSASAEDLWQPVGPKSISNSIPGSLCRNAFTAERSPPSGVSTYYYDPGYAGMPGSGKINAFALDPANSSIMYAGGGSGPGDQGPYSDSGLFKSVDGGRTWFPLRNGFTAGYVDRIWVDPTAPNLVLVGTFDQGIFYSDDSGNSWTRTFVGYTPPANHAIIQDGSDILATSGPMLALSSDLGLHWSVLYTLPSQWFTTLTEAGGIVWAGLTNGTVLKGSVSTGTWTSSISLSDPACGGNGVSTIAVSPANPEDVFVDEACGPTHLFVTTDGGTSWTDSWTSNDPVSSQVLSGANVVAIDPTNASVVYAGADGAMWKSTDGGHTFVPESLYDLDCRGILVYPGGTVVVIGDQGVYESADNGTTWRSLSGTMTNALLTSFAVSGDRLFTTVQDWSPILSYDGGLSWSAPWSQTSPGGEDGLVVVNPGNSSDVYEFTTSGFQLSTDGGVTFHIVPSAGTLPGVLPIGEESNLIGVDPSNPNTVYIATQEGVFKSSDWGSTFSNTTWPFAPARLVAVYPGNPQAIFAGNYSGLYYSLDGGASWRKSILPSNIPPLGPGNFPDSLAFDPENASTLLLSLIGTPSILRSVNGGASFSDTAGTFPGFVPSYFSQAIELAFEPDTGYAVAATTGGIFVSSDLGNTWTEITRNAISNAFSAVQWSGSYLYASTYGEGVLRMPLPPPPQDLTMTGASGSSVSIGWLQPPAEVWSYTVYYGTHCGSWLGYETGTGKTTGVNTSFAVTGLAPATSYCLAVSAWGPAGEGPLSAYVTANTAGVATATTVSATSLSTTSAPSASYSTSTGTSSSALASVSSTSTQTTGQSLTPNSAGPPAQQLPVGEIAIGIGIAVAGVAVAIALVLRKPRAPV